MAVYEALLLNTVVPQIQAAQAGDSYVMVVNATTPALRITQTGTGDALVVEDSANPDSTAFVIDSSGNLGLGVTPSAWASGNKFMDVNDSAAYGAFGNTNAMMVANAYWNGSSWVRKNANNAFRFVMETVNSAPTMNWGVAANGAQGSTFTFTQAMTLDASGNLGVGTTSPQNDSGYGGFTVNGTNGSVITLRAGNSNSGRIYTTATDNINIDANGTASGTILFRTGTSSTERARITSDGYFKASDNGTYGGSGVIFHEFNQTAAAQGVLTLYGKNASTTAAGMLYIETARNTTNNTYYAISYYNTGAAAYKFRVADSGDVTNTNGTYGTISDQKMKTDIVDAGSQWADIKALRFRKFKMKDDPSGLVQLGVVAQEVEITSPGLVDEHQDRDAEGNDLGTTTKSVKTSVLLMKAAVALQEAMARIETLEAEVAALKGA